jgi:hypothetical protein
MAEWNADIRREEIVWWSIALCLIGIRCMVLFKGVSPDIDDSFRRYGKIHDLGCRLGLHRMMGNE